MKEIYFDSLSMTHHLSVQLVELLDREGSTEGAAWYVDDYDNGELMHARLYHMGDYYDIPGLCDLALQRLRDHMTTEFDAKVNRDAVHYLMENTPQEDTRIRMAIAGLLKADLEHFGIPSHAKNLLDQYPLLKDSLLNGILHDDVAALYCGGAIARPIKLP
jgi:hypothetical protein